jgi:DNA-binding NarL/FixJ family response regulator
MIAGADGLASKGSRGDELCRAVRAVAAGRGAMPPISPATMRLIGERLGADDLPILGMLVHGTPPAEVAQTLGMTPEWLEARRWAMLSRLTRDPVRRGRDPARSVPA